MRTIAIIFASALPARGASSGTLSVRRITVFFASALPARGASRLGHGKEQQNELCLGAACTGCIAKRENFHKRMASFASALPARGASAKADKLWHTIL